MEDGRAVCKKNSLDRQGKKESEVNFEKGRVGAVFFGKQSESLGRKVNQGIPHNYRTACFMPIGGFALSSSRKRNGAELGREIGELDGKGLS